MNPFFSPSFSHQGKEYHDITTNLPIINEILDYNQMKHRLDLEQYPTAVVKNCQTEWKQSDIGISLILCLISVHKTRIYKTRGTYY